MRAYLGFWIRTLRRCRRTAPGTTYALLAVIAIEAGSVAMLAACVRWLVDGALDHDLTTATAAAVGTAACLLGVNAGANTRQALHGKIIEIVGLELDREIAEIIVGLPRLEHLERAEFRDRVSLTTGGGTALVSDAWVPIESAGSIAGLIASVALLAQVHPALLLLVVCTPVPLLLNRRGQARVRAAALAAAESGRLEEHLFDQLTSPGPAKEVRTSGAAGYLMRRRAEQWHRQVDLQFRARLAAALLTSAGWAFFTACYAAGLGQVVSLAASGARSAGDLLLAVTLATQLRRQTERTVTAVGGILAGAEVLDSYLWLLRYRAEHREAGAAGSHPEPPAALRHGIDLRGVSFGYPGAGRPAVSDVTVRLPAGATVVVVGEYGSGKSTLVKLLCGLYRADAGSIRVDGTDVTAFPAERWQGRISAVFQDFGRHQIRLGEAIGIGDLARATDEPAVLAAARTVGADAVVEALPDGLGTHIGQDFGGVELSAGQWQKVALARSAMRTGPLLMILDEPTAALDAPSERAIYHAHLRVARDLAAAHGTVTVLVSHRLSSAAESDLILMMADGRLVEAGDHDTLIRAGGQYAELYEIHRKLHAADTSVEPPLP